ncbi:hypothetical protein RHSIM_Rhsim04G0042300 [Rhododendron simsii]|uniref:F-box associated domain-containing protein n=1 Tax=Rhododendron simsii TaxID=118357 RepID=A0A834HAK3_RHOSS|nr:hypothetical protein RHSIM_Rhsim04G0042300 [Rhododendron simsii]
MPLGQTHHRTLPVKETQLGRSPDRDLRSPSQSRIKLVPKINLPKDPKIAFNIVNSCNGFLCLSEPVVRFFCNGDYREVEIYTLGEGFWRNIGNAPYGVKPSEQFRAVPGPSGFCGSQKEYMRLEVLQGCLSMCDFLDGDHVDIWLMKDYGVKQSWSKDFYIVYMINETKIYDYYEPIMVLESGLILMLVNEDSLLVYDPVLNAMRMFTYMGLHPCSVELLMFLAWFHSGILQEEKT